MLFSKNYRKPFWRGLFHAIIVALYCIFISLVYLSLAQIIQVNEILPLIRFTFWLFFALVSIAVCGYFVFFESMKHILNRDFKAGSVMLASTLGWLFIFLIIFILGFALNFTY